MNVSLPVLTWYYGPMRDAINENGSHFAYLKNSECLDGVFGLDTTRLQMGAFSRLCSILIITLRLVLC